MIIKSEEIIPIDRNSVTWIQANKLLAYKDDFEFRYHKDLQIKELTQSSIDDKLDGIFQTRK